MTIELTPEMLLWGILIWFFLGLSVIGAALSFKSEDFNKKVMAVSFLFAPLLLMLTLLQWSWFTLCYFGGWIKGWIKKGETCDPKE